MSDHREHRVRPAPVRAQPSESVPTAAPRPPLPSVRAALTLGLNVGDVRAALPWLSSARTKHVRMGVYWRNMLDPRAHGHLGRRTVERHFLDEVGLAARAGLNVLVVAHMAPDDDPYGGGMPAFIASLASRMPAGVDIQLHNEPNDPTRVWTPRLRGDDATEWGADYARLYARTRAALDARGLRTRLVVGGLAGDPRPFLRGMRGAGASPPVVACHCYGQPARIQAAARASQVRDVFPEARVWYTEIGSELGMRSDAAQARDLTEAVAAAEEAGVERLYWYRLDGPERGFELVTGSEPRAAWHAWRRLAPR